MNQLPASVRSATRFFAFFLANGSLAPDLLGAIDYRPHLVQFGSELEQVFAIFVNVLQVDDTGGVTNEAAAGRRAAEWIRSYNDSSFRPARPFEDWELELA